MAYVSHMATPHVITALCDKRGELAGLIDGLQDQLRQAMIDLDHIDCSLRLFDPDIELDEIRPKPLPPRHHAFKKDRVMWPIQLGLVPVTQLTTFESAIAEIS